MEPRYDTLFYDGQCPLCAKEIRTLRKLQRGNLIFADIHEQRDGSANLPSHEALLRRLHLMTCGPASSRSPRVSTGNGQTNAMSVNTPAPSEITKPLNHACTGCRPAPQTLILRYNLIPSV